VAGLWFGQPGFDSWWGQDLFSFAAVSRLALGLTQPPVQWVLGALSLGVKQLGHEAHLHLVLKLSMHGAITSTPPYIFMAWYFVKHRAKSTFTIILTINKIHI
jgi:hypothetical protein